MHEEQKPQSFICVGKDEEFIVKWGKVNGNPKTEFNSILFTIITPTERIDCHFNNPTAAVEFAKRKIHAKGRGALSTGKVKIVWYDLDNNCSEQILATIQKNIHRRFLPIDKI